jgi:hypothetical protein
VQGDLKLSTITDKCSASLLEVEEVGLRLKAIANDFKHHVPFPRGDEVDISLLEAASSTSRVSWTGLFKDPVYLSRLGLDVPIKLIMRKLRLGRLENL